MVLIGGGAVILNAMIHRQWLYAETWPQMAAIISEVMNNSGSEAEEPYPTPGEEAWLMFSDRRHVDGPDMPDNFLRVSVNNSTGYGGLIWFVSDKYPKREGMFGSVWVSDNPNPPDFDPRVVADSGEPTFHDPKSALPVPQVRAAVEDFCRRGTGFRPECISWTSGWANGHRLDKD
jgi:Immunity protein Imm1